MLTTTRQTKACQIDREITIDTIKDWDWQDVVRGTVHETQHQKTQKKHTWDSYELRRIASEIGGIAVEVRKQMHRDVYHVHLSSELGDSCTCEGGTYRGSCRHLDMVRAAIAQKLL